MAFVNSKWLFPQTIEEAKIVQHELSLRVEIKEIEKPIVHISGMDISNTPFDQSQKIFGAAVILSFPALQIIESATKVDTQKFPYIPGLLGFREAPILTDLFGQLSLSPDIIMVDGHGISHPRGLGVASHLGVLLDVPTIGVAKSILVGKPQDTLGEEVGSQTPLIWKGKIIGMMLRTKRRCNPLIISIGHKVTLEMAVELVLNCLKGYRLPEPTRHAHLAANVCRQKHINS